MQKNRVDKRMILGAIPFFQTLTATHLADLAPLTDVKIVPRGSIIVSQGATGDAAYAVASGFLKVFVLGRDGRATTLALMKEGDVFGELSLLDGGPRSASVMAMSQATVVVLRRDVFMSLLERNPPLAISVLELMGRRLRGLSERSDDVGSLCVGARLARLFWRLAKNYGLPMGPGRRRIRVKLSQQDIGDLIDATRESVNTHLKLWEREGLLVKDGNYLIVPDPDGLRALAENFDTYRFRPPRRKTNPAAPVTRS